jgi:hypothetical protein
MNGQRRLWPAVRGKFPAEHPDVGASMLVNGLPFQLCKAVGVVLRWFESITRLAVETAPDQQKRWSGAVVVWAEWTTVCEVAVVGRSRRGKWL